MSEIDSSDRRHIDYGTLKAVIVEGVARYYELGLSLDFLGEEAQIGFKFVEAYWQQHGVLPKEETVLVSTGLDLILVAYEPLTFWSQHLVRRVRYNVLQQGIKDSYEALRNNNPDLAYDLLKVTLMSLERKVPIGGVPKNIFDIDIIKPYYDKLKEKVIELPTPWPTLTDRIQGFHPEDLTTIVARAGVGKTFLLILILLTIFRAGKKVLLVSTEMKYPSMMARAAAFLVKLPYGKLRRGDLATVEEDLLWNVLSSLRGNRNFLIFGEGFDVTLERIEAVILQERPSIVGVDGAYLLKGANIHKKDQRHDIIGQIWENLKSIAKRHKIPIIVNSQMNRSSVNKKVDQDRTAFSEDINRLSDNVIFVDRPENSSNTLKLIMGKLREADSHDDIMINWNFDTCDFSELGNFVV